MQISSQNSIHVWLEIEDNCFASLDWFCVCIFLKMPLICLNELFQPEAALRRQKSLVGVGSFGDLACQYELSDTLRAVLMLNVIELIQEG